MQLGIIGYPLVHTFSPAYFHQKFARLGIAASYDAFPLAHITELPALLAARPGLCGLNVTIPYKETVIPYLHHLHTTAQDTGAVNCIDIRQGIATGYNTDAGAFELSLVPLLQPQHTEALVLGTGGGAKAVCRALQQLGIPYHKVSRAAGADHITYQDVTTAVVARCHLIVNTTPLGQYPHTAAAAPIPYEAITPAHLLYDLVYNPDETQFLARGRERGAAVKNGFEMLQLQAEAGWAIWSAHR